MTNSWRGASAARLLMHARVLATPGTTADVAAAWGLAPDFVEYLKERYAIEDHPHDPAHARQLERAAREDLRRESDRFLGRVLEGPRGRRHGVPSNCGGLFIDELDPDSGPVRRCDGCGSIHPLPLELVHEHQAAAAARRQQR